MKEQNTKLETKRVIIYLCITFLMTIVYCVGIIYPLNNHADIRTAPSMTVQLLIAVVMFFPALGVVLTRLVTKEGFKNAWIHPRFKENVKYYLIAWFGPGILTLLGAVLYFVLNPGSFDPACSYFEQLLISAGASADMIPMPLSTLLLIQCVQALLFGPILNFVTCFGEEWGWRGYLMPKMSQKLPIIPMFFVTGIIWGLWHVPLTIIGHNYGTGYKFFPFAGIAAMCLFCTVVGTFLSYLSLKTQSCIPAVLGHAGVNSISTVGMYFTKDGGNPFLGPVPSGIVGMIPFIIVVIILLTSTKKNIVQ